MSTPSLVQPRLTILSLEQIEQVHAQSLEILARVGLRVDSPRAAKVLEKSHSAQLIT